MTYKFVESLRIVFYTKIITSQRENQLIDQITKYLGAYCSLLFLSIKTDYEWVSIHVNEREIMYRIYKVQIIKFRVDEIHVCMYIVG